MAQDEKIKGYSYIFLLEQAVFVSYRSGYWFMQKKLAAIPISMTPSQSELFQP